MPMNVREFLDKRIRRAERHRRYKASLFGRLDTIDAGLKELKADFLAIMEKQLDLQYGERKTKRRKP